MGKTIVTALCAAALLVAADAKLLKDAGDKLKAKKYDEALTLLDPAFKKTPNDAALAKALADAHLQYGDFYLNNSAMPPFQKYPNALRQYRQVLAYDKTNTDAQGKIKLIEGIYKSMGRPVPQ